MQAYVTTCTKCSTIDCGAGNEQHGCGGTSSGSCRGQQCPALSAPTDGSVSFDPTDRRQPVTASYRLVTVPFRKQGEAANHGLICSCNTGYESVGATDRDCSTSVLWQGSAPTCRGVDCGSLIGTLNNGVVTHASTRHPSSATYGCDNGYSLVGSASRRCQANEAWSGPAPTCKGKPCAAAPVIGNGTATIQGDGNFPSSITYACNSGYGLEGTAASACAATTLQWKDASPTCRPLACATLSNPTNGRVSRSLNGLYPSVATYSCDAGYERKFGSLSRSCQAGDTVPLPFDGLPLECQGKQCETLVAPANGGVSETTARYPFTVGYHCDAGYELTGSSSRSCLMTTAWSDSAPTCQACAVNEYKAGIAAGSKCTACPAFSSTNGATGLSDCSCLAGYGYNVAAQACEACSINSFKADIGDTSCTPCPLGYMTDITGATLCVGVPCQTATTTSHGSVTTTLNNQHPSEASYVCDQGFALPEGDDGMRNCQPDSSWGGIVPDCSPICGDGLHVAGEECDDGQLGNSGCDDSCKLVPGYFCETPNALCSLCSFTVAAQDTAAACENHVQALAAWQANKLGSAVDVHSQCGVASYEIVALDLNGADETCGSHNYRINVNFSKGGSDSSVAAFITQDTNMPTLVGKPSDQTIECTTIPEASTVTGSDLCGQNVVVNSTEARSDEQCAGKYTLTRTWTAVDACQNSFADSTRYTVVDTVAPTITEQPSPLVLECDRTPQLGAIQPWLDLAGGAKAIDECGGTVSWSNDFAAVQSQLSQGCTGTGSVTVTFTAADDCGNSVNISATIVHQDTHAPTLTNLPEDVDIDCSLAIPDAAAVGATDACDPAPAVVLTERTEQDLACSHALTIYRTWTATDACGMSINHTQTISIVDSTGPNIATQPVPLVQQCSPGNTSTIIDSYLNAHGHAQAQDACGGLVTWSHELLDLAPTCGLMGQTPVIFTATDICGNAATVETYLKLEDTTPPSLLNLTTGVISECDAIPSPRQVSVFDACDSDPLVTFKDSVVPGRCAHTYTIQRQVIATDHCMSLCRAYLLSTPVIPLSQHQPVM